VTCWSWAGPRAWVGAAWLAARAALAAGAGRVYLQRTADRQPQPDAAAPEADATPPVWLADAGTFERATVVCGCGGGSRCGAALPHLLDMPSAWCWTPMR
jgi:NAD(P)H-hydrate repair Nnr-like enzyme with NAD(P)H-hydrate dehydratase domain